MAHDRAWHAAATRVLELYPFEVTRIERIPQGLINVTLKVTSAVDDTYILQRLHPVFGAGVNDSLDAVTRHLAHKRLTTPRLVHTAAGEICVVDEGASWRLVTFIRGRAFDHVSSSAQASAAGGILGEFHLALADFEGELPIDRPPAHDLERHFATLAATLARHPNHALHAPASALAQALVSHRAALPVLARAAPRVVHGDPKISNILFDEAGSAGICMIDLDTLTRMPLALELGDAFRSWCNPGSEDSPDAGFALDLFEAAARGYAASANVFVEASEWRAIVPAVLHITLELAARFCTDALAESYFGWDPEGYPSRGAHNLARARGQFEVFTSLAQVRERADVIILEAFS